MGVNSFAVDPPNADFTCKVRDEVVSHVVELASPSLVGDGLSYAVNAVGATVLRTGGDSLVCDADSRSFVDDDLVRVFHCGAAKRGIGCKCRGDSDCASEFCFLGMMQARSG